MTKGIPDGRDWHEMVFLALLEFAGVPFLCFSFLALFGYFFTFGALLVA
jgi:hypothetical protein